MAGDVLPVAIFCILGPNLHPFPIPIIYHAQWFRQKKQVCFENLPLRTVNVKCCFSSSSSLLLMQTFPWRLGKSGHFSQNYQNCLRSEEIVASRVKVNISCQSFVGCKAKFVFLPWKSGLCEVWAQSELRFYVR